MLLFAVIPQNGRCALDAAITVLNIASIYALTIQKLMLSTNTHAGFGGLFLMRKKMSKSYYSLIF